MTPQASDLVERLLALVPFLEAHHCDPSAITEAIELEADNARWKSLAIGLHSQFDHQGCTCTFSSDDCCAFARVSAALNNGGNDG